MLLMKTPKSALASFRTKAFQFYIVAIVGAYLGEFEVHRAGNWSAHAVRPLYFVFVGATPMLLIMSASNMSRKLLTILSGCVGIGILILGVQAAHADVSTVWVDYFAALWLWGTLIACVTFAFLTLYHRSTKECSQSSRDSN